jgi:hypothetical protein
MRRTLLITAGVLVVAAGHVGAVPSVPLGGSTLNLTAQFVTNGLGQQMDCPPGAIECFVQTANAAVPGLGHTTLNSTLLVEQGPGSCPPGELSGTLAAGGDTVSFSGTTDCVPAQGTATFQYSITSGSGHLAGASGSGHLDYSFASDTTARYSWNGTLAVPGYSFDTTPPVFSGIHKRLTRVGRRAKRARVRYAVAASDDVDGAVSATCRPASGSWFRLGATAVHCSASDAHANVARASFRVIVKRKS